MNFLNNFKYRIFFFFLLFNSIFFINPFIVSWNQFPSEDFFIMFFIFLLTLFFESILIFLFNFNRLFIILLFMFNYLNFILFLLPYPFVYNLILFFNFIMLAVLYLYFNYYKFILLYSFIYFSSSFIIFLNSTIQFDFPKVSLLTKSAKRNIYFIGIDGLVSECFYSKFYQSEFVLADTLRKEGFNVFDFESPGESTLKSYASLISYYEGNNIAPSKLKKVISSKESFFYADSKRMGYKLQFVYSNNYFGINSNGPFDVFFPSKIEFFSFYNYVNEFWAFPLKYIISSKFNSNNDHFLNLKKELVNLDLNNNYWISISHVWYPGHTSSFYNSKNNLEYLAFKKYYIDSQKNLIKNLIELKQLILNKDKDAIIVFWGDHGSYLLRNNLPSSYLEDSIIVSQKDLKMDSTSVLVAIYPSVLGREIESSTLESQFLFRSVIDLAN